MCKKNYHAWEGYKMALVYPAYFLFFFVFLLPFKSKVKVPEEVNYTLHTWLVVNLCKGEVFSYFLLSLDELAALISAAH